MKFFCKKILMIPQVLLFAASLAVLLAGCATESEESDLLPDNQVAFWMFPNDGALSDSVDQNLTHGIILEVHADAEYTLSFDADEEAGAPTLKLYRLRRVSQGAIPSKVRSLKASLENGRYVYRFLCEEKDAAEWATVLQKDGKYYQGSTNNTRFTGDGAYSDHLSLNLVLVGNVEQKLSGYTKEDLASAMLARFRQFYTGIVIDTLYVNYAENHPTNGKQFPSNEPWIAGRSDDDIMMSKLGGGWSGADGALDLVLVHYIDEVGLLGYSYLFSGNLKGGEGSTVVLGAFVKTNAGTIANSMDAIVETAVHESGHFLGLRHTTATKADLAAVGDYSMLEDGLSDTPFCEGLISSGLVKKKTETGSDMKIRYGGWRLRGRTAVEARGGFDINACPDVANLMFPVETGVEYEPLTPMQQDLVRKTLMIYPH